MRILLCFLCATMVLLVNLTAVHAETSHVPNFGEFLEVKCTNTQMQNGEVHLGVTLSPKPPESHVVTQRTYHYPSITYARLGLQSEYPNLYRGYCDLSTIFDLDRK